jgi:hypothetical protein
VKRTVVRTGKGKADVVVNHGDLADRSRVLQLEGRLLLDAEHDARRRLDTDGGRALGDGLERIVDLWTRWREPVSGGSAMKLGRRLGTDLEQLLDELGGGARTAVSRSLPSASSRSRTSDSSYVTVRREDGES